MAFSKRSPSVTGQGDPGHAQRRRGQTQCAGPAVLAGNLRLQDDHKP